MTRPIALLLALAAFAVAGCGKYGPPVRASESVGVGAPAAGHAAASCEDPEHDHEAEATP